MKVYILRPNHEIFLEIKASNFSEPNREANREHILQTTGASNVWFEDEEPPQLFIDLLTQGQQDE